MDGPTIKVPDQDRGNLQTRAVNHDSGVSLTRKEWIPRYLSKKTRRQRRGAARALAEVKAKNDHVDGDSFGFTEDFVLCLPCEDKAYSGELFNLKSRPNSPLADEGARIISNPLRTSEVKMNPIGSFQPWLVSVDDGSLSDTINTQNQ